MKTKMSENWDQDQGSGRMTGGGAGSGRSSTSTGSQTTWGACVTQLHASGALAQTYKQQLSLADRRHYFSSIGRRAAVQPRNWTAVACKHAAAGGSKDADMVLLCKNTWCVEGLMYCSERSVAFITERTETSCFIRTDMTAMIKLQQSQEGRSGCS